MPILHYLIIYNFHKISSAAFIQQQSVAHYLHFQGVHGVALFLFFLTRSNLFSMKQIKTLKKCCQFVVDVTDSHVKE